LEHWKKKIKIKEENLMEAEGLGRKISNQLVGNTGLFYVCYELSKRGWNCLPTTRNARGVDIIIYDLDGERKLTIQVKTLSKKNPVPFGSKLEVMADFVIICAEIFSESPKVYILEREEVKKMVKKMVKDNRVSYWLQPKDYENDRYRNRWEVIGKGY
jgi:hypothetical protein